MKIIELENRIKESYKNYFPNSRVKANYSSNIMPNIAVVPYLVENQNESLNRIIENDMFHIAFSIEGFKNSDTKESETPNNLTLVVWRKSIAIKTASKYLVYDRHVLPFRKQTGNAEKIAKKLDDYFKKLKEDCLRLHEQGQIHENFIELFESKLEI